MHADFNGDFSLGKGKTLQEKQSGCAKVYDMTQSRVARAKGVCGRMTGKRG